MRVRRVVTGHTSDGKATFVDDSEVEAIKFETFPGLQLHRFWGADETPTFPDDGSPPASPSYFPPVNGFRFGLFTVAPMSVKGSRDGAAIFKEMEEKAPGLVAHMEADNPGMHTTDTIDFEYVISGEIWLELDNGEEVHLKAGDTVIQNGTRHAWRNKSAEPCCMVVCSVGANRR